MIHGLAVGRPRNSDARSFRGWTWGPVILRRKHCVALLRCVFLNGVGLVAHLVDDLVGSWIPFFAGSDRRRWPPAISGPIRQRFLKGNTFNRSLGEGEVRPCWRHNPVCSHNNDTLRRGGGLRVIVVRRHDCLTTLLPRAMPGRWQ